MPHIELGEVRIHYRLDGKAGMPTLALSNSLGTTFHMWDKVLPVLTEHYRVLCYDTRGHGESSVPQGPYTLPQLANDLLALIDALQIECCHFCGVSLGGMTGIWLGIHHTNRVEKLILSNTAARIGATESWNDRIRGVQEHGVAAIAGSIIERWFTPAFRTEHPEEMKEVREMLSACSTEGYAGCCAAIRDMDMSADLARIGTPTLVVAGALDPVIPADACRLLHEKIRNAVYVELNSAHLSPIERATEFADAALRFLESSGA
jgi:3-oxoadipate enol-lactonase